MATRLQWFWRGYAVVYDHIWDSPLTRAALTTALRDLGPAGVAVDLGCGTGLSAAPLVRAGWTVVGVDASLPMLDRARAAGRITRGIPADAAATGLDHATADAVVIANLLHLHPDPVAVLDEARRIVRPGGVIVCLWPAATATFTRALAADVAYGRPWPSALGAAILRMVVGLAGAPVNARQLSAAAVADTLQRWLADGSWHPTQGSATELQDFVRLRTNIIASRTAGVLPT
ncbi:MAG: class I SAM-dependent methyltransferase [Propionibacteriaceae bacterium]|jgi:SAM-dependent methyltransferase|nr:class I SAM-dependent methyltransferase [Propionibacteriaceae bacterium]